MVRGVEAGCGQPGKGIRVILDVLEKKRVKNPTWFGRGSFLTDSNILNDSKNRNGLKRGQKWSGDFRLGLLSLKRVFRSF
jgi:hypothetical protein